MRKTNDPAGLKELLVTFRSKKVDGGKGDAQVARRSWAAGAQRLTTQDGHLRNLGIPVSCGWGGCGWLWGRLGRRPTLAALGICQSRL